MWHWALFLPFKLPAVRLNGLSFSLIYPNSIFKANRNRSSDSRLGALDLRPTYSRNKSPCEFCVRKHWQNYRTHHVRKSYYKIRKWIALVTHSMNLLECEFMDWCQVERQSSKMLNGSTFAWRFGLPAQLALCQGVRVSYRLKLDVLVSQFLFRIYPRPK